MAEVYNQQSNLSIEEIKLVNCLAEALDSYSSIYIVPRLIPGNYDIIVDMGHRNIALLIQTCTWNIQNFLYIEDKYWIKQVEDEYFQELSPFVKINVQRKNYLYEKFDNTILSCEIDGIDLKRAFIPIVYFPNTTEKDLISFLKDDLKELHWNNFLGKDTLDIPSKLLNKINRCIIKRRIIPNEKMSICLQRFLNPDAVQDCTSIPYETYTNKQKEIINDFIYKRKEMCIKGPAGSGKSQLLAKIKTLIDEKGKHSIFITYNITLKRYIKFLQNKTDNNITEKIDPLFDSIMHYHTFLYALLSDLGIYLSNIKEYDKDWSKRITKELPEERKFNVIIVDEAQDYKKNWVKNIRASLKKDGKIIFAGDIQQNIYHWEEDDARTETINNSFYTGVTGAPRRLEQQSFRLPEKIASLCNNFASQFLPQYKEYPIEPMSSLFNNDVNIFYQEIISFSDEDIGKNIFKTLSSTKFTDKNFSNVSIIGEDVLSLRKIDQYFRKIKNIETMTIFETQEEYEKLKEKYKTQKELEKFLYTIRKNKKIYFNPYLSKLKLCTIQSFKGWESENVILILPIDFPLDDYDKESYYISRDELIYTALSRATKNLFIIDPGCLKYQEFFRNYPDVIKDSSPIL